MIYTIKGFTWSKSSREGAHAKNTEFTLKAKDGKPERTISVFDYYKETYNITLNYWFLPLVDTPRNGYIPMELCTLLPNQRYQFKMSPEQVWPPLVLSFLVRY